VTGLRFAPGECSLKLQCYFADPLKKEAARWAASMLHLRGHGYRLVQVEKPSETGPEKN